MYISFVKKKKKSQEICGTVNCSEKFDIAGDAFFSGIHNCNKRINGIE